MKWTLANILTSSRIFLSPVFFLLFRAIDLGQLKGFVPLAALLVLFLVLEMTDLFDGLVARKMKQTSDFGKIFDPLADSICRLTYFISFTLAGMMAGWILLILVYRDVLVAYVRLVLMQNKVVMGAKWSGKIKAWVYAAGGIYGILYFYLKNSLHEPIQWDILNPLKDIVFIGCAVMALITVVDYLSSIRGVKKK
ncbi:MAG: CDP-diacylglycerol--glycerol-3-phosphate 3-phosphatidyltransferase [Spirochaetales bacterium]|nr:CDP-diacylglycerol--glycerol-3-phosphate 3-phosphatidyltransferase [Spirochaetales bacterium]